MNSTKHYDVVTFLGRMEPPHKGHLATILKAFDHGDFVLVVLGSHNSARNIKNPWTTEERKRMILDSLPLELQTRIAFVGAEDYMYSDAEWLTEVTKSIRQTAQAVSLKPQPSIAMIALSKDESTYYLNYFKFLDIIPMEEIKVGGVDAPSLSATKIRELYFGGYLNFIKDAVPLGAYEFLVEFTKTPEFAALREEYVEALKYQDQYATAPYGNTNFVTVDNVVIQSGHVLLIKRGKSPGKGLWALPGGHLNNDETFLEGAIRELREETCLKVPEKVLKGSIFAEKVFDHPDRSLRCRVNGKKGRTITYTHGFKLDDAEKLPHVRGADDAEDARWIPIDIVINEMRAELFEDHYDQIKYFVARL